ncbi:hypothetical protein B0J13DRAFT_565275 [Dactylonectria estremocensis]|uniref:Uncharacterized protein n=1 Tax=Dactylonectria estremocensis TaxID=1079267 RepID=A0A9P9DWK0_9HYPO|nr:hypothetical protein B0J13DRAFT_565275 [Dactylonectria estremocensis]
MTRVSILYLRQHDPSDERNCLRIELNNFLVDSRLYDGEKDGVGQLGYAGPAILVVEDHDQSDDIICSIKRLLRNHEEAQSAFPGQMIDNLVKSDSCRVPERMANESRDMWSIIKYRDRLGPHDKTDTWLGQNEDTDFGELLMRQNRLVSSNIRVATWVCEDTSIFCPIPKVTLSGFVLLMFEKSAKTRGEESFASILQTMFAAFETNGIADAIEEHPLLIYLYLHFCFNDFAHVIDGYEQLFRTALSTNGRTTRSGPDWLFTLRIALGQTSAILSDTLQHKAVLLRLKEYNDMPNTRTRDIGTENGLAYAREQARATLSSMEREVDVLVASVHLSLEMLNAHRELKSNLCDESMNWDTRCLAFAAILFMPALFITSTFGMDILGPKWPFLSTVPVLLASCSLIWYIFSKSQILHDEAQPKKIQNPPHTMSHLQIDTLQRKKRRHGRAKSNRRRSWIHDPSRRQRRHSYHYQPASRIGSSRGFDSDSNDLSAPSPFPPTHESASLPPSVTIDGRRDSSERPERVPATVSPQSSSTGIPYSSATHPETLRPPLAQGYPAGQPSRTASERFSEAPRSGSKPGHCKDEINSSTTYSNLRMPDFRSRPSRRVPRPSGDQSSYDPPGDPSYRDGAPRPAGYYRSSDKTDCLGADLEDEKVSRASRNT